MPPNLNSTRKRPRESEEDDSLGRGYSSQRRYENISTHDHAQQYNGDQYHGPVNIYQGTAAAICATRSPEPTAVESALDSLMFDEMDARYLTINASLAPSSCHWLLDREEYQRWQDIGSISEHHGFLWIKGKAGAGKSTLMKYAFNTAEKTRGEDETVVSFFFNARGAPIERSLSGMYRALLYQILHKLPHLRPLLGKRRTLSAQSQDWSISVLRSIFQDVVESFTSERLTCYVDALDECMEDDVKDMVSFFEDLGESSVSNGTKFYVCFASRHYPHISIDQSEEIVLEDQDGHKGDISFYIAKKLRIPGKPLKREISKQIEDRASGVFLWVVLVVGILNDECDRGNVQVIRTRLKEIPTGLTDLIQDILQRDKPTKYLVPLLQWILFSRRPLSREELFLALQSIEPDAIQDSHTPEALARDNIDKFILNTSKGLAELTKGKKPRVQFIHELVRTHFLGPDGLVKLEPLLQMHLVSQSHDQLKRCCHNYIVSETCTHVPLPTALPQAESPEGKGLRSQTLGALPLIQYALENVLYHSNLAHVEGVEQHGFLESFPFDAWKRLDDAIARHTSHRHTDSATQAYLLAEQGCAALLTIAMRSQPKPDAPKERCRSILGAAIDARDIGSVQAVLAPYNGYENSVGKDNSTCISLAVENHDLEIVQALVAAKAKPYKAKISSEKHYAASKNNALVFAASQPHIFALKLGRLGLLHLLLAGLSNEDKSSRSCVKAIEYALEQSCRSGDMEAFNLLYTEGRLPAISPSMLCEASRSGNQQLVQSILQTGISVNVTVPNFRGESETALSAASAAGHEHILDLLLARDADVNHAESNALRVASSKGHETVVRTLLENGAKVDRSCRGAEIGIAPLTALQVACQCGHEAVARLLIKNGASIDYKGAQTWVTPLFIACCHGQTSIVQVLIEHHASLDIPDGFGNTPLLTALARQHLVIAHLLIEAGADAHVVGSRKATALWHACRHGNEDIVQLLINKGANVNAKVKARDFYDEDKTALRVAEEKNYTSIVRLLVENGATG